MTMYEEIHLKLSEHLLKTEKDVVIVCIGTDRNTGDSLGPFVGSFLQEKTLPATYVYGTIDKPVTAVNVAETMKKIHSKHPNTFIIGIDAALSSVEKIGCVYVQEIPITPGSVVGKKLVSVGDISIVGVVNERYETPKQNINSLGNTRLRLVLKMAKTISNAIEQAIFTTQLEKDYSIS